MQSTNKNNNNKQNFFKINTTPLMTLTLILLLATLAFNFGCTSKATQKKEATPTMESLTMGNADDNAVDDETCLPETVEDCDDAEEKKEK